MAQTDRQSDRQTMSVIELSWTAKKIVSSLLEYMVFNIMQFISNFFLGIQKVAKSVFVVVQLHFSGNSINIQQNFFYSKIGMKNKLMIPFIKQSHHRTNIFAKIWEQITLHMQEYEKLEFFILGSITCSLLYGREVWKYYTRLLIEISPQTNN